MMKQKPVTIVITFLKETWTINKTFEEGKRGVCTKVTIASSKKDSMVLEVLADYLLEMVLN